MQIDRITVGQLEVNCYVISTDGTGDAIVIDPGDEADRILDLVQSRSLLPRFVVFTHAHYDHVCAGREVADAYRAPVVMHRDDRGTYAATKSLCISWGYREDDFPSPDMIVSAGDEIRIGPDAFRIIHTPGHSPGSICLLGGNTLITGDTLFRGSVGRTDLPGGDPILLFASLRKLITLPPETRVLPGHLLETSIGDELTKNPFLRRL